MASIDKYARSAADNSDAYTVRDRTVLGNVGLVCEPVAAEVQARGVPRTAAVDLDWRNSLPPHTYGQVCRGNGHK
jgi:hypothetical protein